jgi:hypothetical protein
MKLLILYPLLVYNLVVNLYDNEMAALFTKNLSFHFILRILIQCSVIVLDALYAMYLFQ